MSLRNPFPGLRPFRAKESHLFFGRARHIDEILRKVNLYRFVSIVGTSGSGKSSLIRAGLLPTLHNLNEGWLVCALRPDENPIRSLTHALKENESLKPGLGSEEELETIVKKSGRGLVQALRPCLGPDQKLLLLIDQFEELFRYKSTSKSGDDEFDDDHFVDLLLGCIEQKDVPIYVVITLRSDFLGDCEQYMGLPEAINNGQFLIPRMNKDELRECITGPVSYAGAKISPRLVQLLIQEIGSDPDQLPVLQHALMRTWEQWEEQGEDIPIDIEHYNQTGGLSSALSSHAEEAYKDLKPGKQQEIAEILFKTVTTKGLDNRGVRRPTSVQKVSEIANVKPGEVIEVANIFRKEGRGFIMPPPEIPLAADSIIDISHESLMRVWDRLRNWVEEEAEAAELYHHITSNAQLYNQERAGLWRDPDLQIALDWRSKKYHNKPWSEQYNNQYDLVQTFIDLSENDKKYHLAETQRRKRFQKAALITFLVVLSGLSIWAVSERNRSIKNARAAVLEKKESEKQRGIAEDQKTRAENNLTRAQEEERKALLQQKETEKQRILALQKAEEARLAKLRSEEAALEALKSREMAIKDRLRAENQQKVSDSLRLEAERAGLKTQRLQMLSLAQNVAIKSKMAQDYTFDESVKIQLALKSYDINKAFNGDPLDPEIFGAIFSAYRLIQKSDEYMHRQHRDVPKSITYDKVTDQFLSAGNDGMIVAAKLTNGPLALETSTPSTLFLDNVTISPNGYGVGTTCDNNSVQIYDLKNFKGKARSLEGIHDKEIMDLIWTDRFLISASLDKTVKITSSNGKNLIRTYELDAKPLTMALSNDQNVLLVGCDNGTVYKINPNTDGTAQTFSEINKGRINGICFNSKSTIFAIGTDQGYSATYAMKDPKSPVSILSGHKAGVTGITFHPTMNILATSSNDKIVRLWNIDESNPQPIEFKEHTHWVLDVSFDKEGNNLASAGKDRTVRIYPLNVQEMAEKLRTYINGDLSREDWRKYVSEEIPYWSSNMKI